MSRASSRLRDQVYRANMELAGSGLVSGTFGNVSGVDRAAGLFLIKPSGVPYRTLTPEQLVPVSLATGEVIGRGLRPSSDTPTHLELYRAFPRCGGIVHTHSESATALAQAGLAVRCLGTTHADHFRGDVKVTRALTSREVEGDYERNTGRVIVELFRKGRLSPDDVPAVLVRQHGPFAWGTDAAARSRERTRARARGAARDPGARDGRASQASRPLPDRQALPAQARQGRVLRAEVRSS